MNYNISLFPYVLNRVSGAPFPNLIKGYKLNISLYLKERKDIISRIDECKFAVSESLMQDIKALPDENSRLYLYNFRRRFYHNKYSIIHIPDEVDSLISKNTKTNIQSYYFLQNALKESNFAIRDTYVKVKLGYRIHLKRLSKKDYLSKGLTLASHTLLDSLKYYRQADINLNNKEISSVELGLLKYLSRIHCKTSPFSTFGRISLTKVDDTLLDASLYKLTASSFSIARINNIVYKMIIDSIYTINSISNHLPLSLNSTTIQKVDCYRFLVIHNSIESFQTINRSPVVDLIFDTLKSGDSYTRKLLVESIRKNISASHSSLSNFISKLTEYGLIEYDINVSAMDPNWDIALIARFDSLFYPNNSNINYIVKTLKLLRKLISTFNDSPQHKRRNILTRCCSIVFKLKSRLERLSGHSVHKVADEVTKSESVNVYSFKKQFPSIQNISAESIIYEDCIFDKTLEHRSDHLSIFADILQTTITKLSLLNSGNSESRNMACFFVSNYGTSNIIPLLVFYEDYIKWSVNGNKEPKSQPNFPLVNSEFTAYCSSLHDHFIAIEKLKYDWQHTFVSRFNLNHESINIEISDIVSTNELLDISDEPGNQSTGCLMQFYTDSESSQPMAVVNGTLTGFGRLMGRFFHLFPKHVEEETKNWNANLCDNSTLFVENCDNSYFNANMHPPLFPQEVRMPSSQNMLPQSSTISVADISVRFNSKSRSLYLESNGKMLNVIDMGFQNTSGRTKLYRIIDIISSPHSPLILPMIRCINNEIDKINSSSTIKIYPRLTLMKRLVIQRKHWMISVTDILTKKTTDDEFEYFCSLNQWRISLNMPTEVFVNINPFRKPSNDAVSLNEFKRSDSYKPQYIHFENPIHVVLLSKLLSKARDWIKFEEMLPSSGQLNTISGSSYITESLVQWYAKK